jgi:ABC-type nitrate/sulfonate/bicarbonate transport system substrate-binding protein
MPMPGFNDAGVVFTRKETGIHNLEELRGKSFLMGTADSTMTFWAKVNLAEAGVKGRDLNGIRFIDRMVDLLPDRSARKANALGNPYSSMTAVEAVLAGKYDAGVVREKRFREVAAEKGLVALAKFSDEGDLLVARGNLPMDVANAFQRLMLSVKDSALNQPLLNSPARFRAAVNSDFETMISKLPAEAAFDE